LNYGGLLIWWLLLVAVATNFENQLSGRREESLKKFFSTNH
jgi:hypothetical protein